MTIGVTAKILSSETGTKRRRHVKMWGGGLRGMSFAFIEQADHHQHALRDTAGHDVMLAQP